MTEIEAILSDTSHRPFAIPDRQWQYYQEWNNALFLHWKIPFDSLRKCVPEKFNLDIFDGDCYVSLVAFTMQNIRPRHLPAIKFVSDFHEINIRTYIDNDYKKGVYFLNIEAEKYFSVLVAKTLSGLPYEKADIKRSDNFYHSINKTKNFRLDATFKASIKLLNKTPLDTWLTERYCLYLDKNDKAYRYEIHHKEWEIQAVDIKELELYYKIDNIILSDLKPDIAHYSYGAKVLAWAKQPV